MSKKKTTKQFIEDAKLIHGDKYDYSKVYYINSQTNVIIICNTHGEFNQSPNKHLCKQGCPKCSKNRKLTNENFIEKAYSFAAGIYYKKGNIAKAKQTLKNGLIYSPDNFGLKLRLNQL